MNSKYFKDPQTALEVFVETFQRLAADETIAQQMIGLNQLVYFDYTQDDPTTHFFVDARGGQVKVGAGQPPEPPAVTMINSVDVAHQSWSNKLNPMMAMATGKIKARGSAAALLKLAPLLKRIAPVYNQVLDEKGLSEIKL